LIFHCRKPEEHHQAEALESDERAGGEVRLGPGGGQEVLRLSSAHARVQSSHPRFGGRVPAASVAGAGGVRLGGS